MTSPALENQNPGVGVVVRAVAVTFGGQALLSVTAVAALSRRRLRRSGLAHPDWGAAAKGAVVPSIPLNRDALLVAVATLFGLGFLAAALLAAAIVPLSTAYSISETLGRKADLDDSFEEARSFYSASARW